MQDSEDNSAALAPVSTPATDTQSIKPVRHELAFSGDGGEYFRIWIVNLALTVLTLGIFSAWAKVRSKRYFYGNTELAGDRFDYLANPIAILKGRIVAVIALGAYTLAQMFSTTLTFVVIGAIILALPFLVVRAVRFAATMTAWRGIRLGFDGDYWGAIKAYILWPLFGIVTFGFGMPYAWMKKNHYLVNHYRYGKTQAHSSASGGDFYVIALATGGMAVCLFILFAILAGIAAIVSSDAEGAGTAIAVFAPAMTLLIYISIYILYQALTFSTVYNNIHFGGHRIRNTVKASSWVWISVTNSILLVLTLGFYYPWARVRLTRYIIANVYVDSPGLDELEATDEDIESAFGEEIGEAFDLGLGL